MSAPVAAQGSRWDVLAQAAARRSEGDDGGLDRSWLLCFELAGTPYALPVERVRGIVRVRPVTPMPRVPREVLGVISLRGEIVQVVDLRRRLGLAEAPCSRASRVVIVDAGDGRIAGLLVDRVFEVISVGEDALRPPATEAAVVASLCVQGERFVSVLDLDRVLVFDAE